MAPQVRALAQSESKAKFMARLGLNERDPGHKHLYHMMKEEASAGRKRMMGIDPSDVLRDASESSVQPPFSNAQLSETATHREILNIYRHARPETRRYYDMGRDTDGLEEENWVIRWLLWHVFRYRDNRNKNRRQGSPGPPSSSSERSSSEIHGSTKNVNAHDASVVKSGFYDPVRDTQSRD